MKKNKDENYLNIRGKTQKKKGQKMEEDTRGKRQIAQKWKKKIGKKKSK